MKKIIAVILTVSFLAVMPAQAASPDRKVVTTQSVGGGIWCCDAIPA
ncbi:MAG: hypothetical protein Q8K48_03915 [Candidatus Planktophila sp.]|nr:hypothetical protein [Candidatus Planktophila sp.]